MKIKERLVNFTTEDGLELMGLFLEPEGAERVLVFIHGFGGNFYWKRLINNSQYLLDSKISLLSINTRGSEIIKNFKKNGKNILVGSALEKFEECLFDIGASIDFCERNKYSSVILCGYSSGCQKIVYYQSIKQDKRVKGLINIAPGDDYNIIKQKVGKNFENLVKKAKKLASIGKGDQLFLELFDYGIIASANRFLSQCYLKNPEARIFNYNLKKMEYVRKIKIPMLVVYGEKDEYVAGSLDFYQKKIQENYKGKLLEFLIIKDATHNFSGKERELIKSIKDFVLKV